MVVDLETGKLAGDIPSTLGVHGIALAPELGRGFTSNGRTDNVTIFSLDTLKPIGEVKTGKNPDCILYDPASGRVFTFNGRSGDATAFNAATGVVDATIPLDGKPEFARSDEAGRIFVNIEDKSEVVEIDSRKLTVLGRFPLAPCEGPSGMALDVKHHHVFSGCHNKVMTVFDCCGPNAGKVIASVPIGAGVDANGFDAATGLAFSSNGDGTLTVVRESSPGKFEVAETVATERGARTMAIDPKTHRIYLPTARYGAPDAPTQDQPHPRPTLIPDTFTIVVVGTK
jgi:DNA-binding beta-propeller fold protein YncE